MTSVVDRTTRVESSGSQQSTEPVRRGRRSPLVTVLRWASIVVVGAVVLELACRVEDWVMYRMPLLSRFETLNDLIERDADGMHGRPNAQFEKWTMNGLGTRGPEATLLPPPGTTRVITVGASETFGLRENPGKEYPRQLEDSIAARVRRGECGPGASARFEVLNAAFAGMSIPTMTQDIRNRLVRMKPAIIFAYPSAAQYLEEEMPTAAPPDSSGRSTVQPMSAAFRPRVANRIREQIKTILPEWLKTVIRGSEKDRSVKEHPAGWQFTSVPQERVVAFENDLRRLIGTIRGIGAEPVLATHANLFMGRTKRDAYALVAWEKFYPRATGETIIAFDSVARVAMTTVAADSNVAVVDAATRLASAPATAFGDFVHFTDLGASHMADVASEGVLATARAKGICGGTPAQSTTELLQRRGQ